VRLRFTTAAPLVGAQRITHIETQLESLLFENGLLETTIPARGFESYNLAPRR
jgi:hypothetical protein